MSVTETSISYNSNEEEQEEEEGHGRRTFEGTLRSIVQGENEETRPGYEP